LGNNCRSLLSSQICVLIIAYYSFLFYFLIMWSLMTILLIRIVTVASNSSLSQRSPAHFIFSFLFFFITLCIILLRKVQLKCVLSHSQVSHQSLSLYVDVPKDLRLFSPAYCPFMFLSLTWFPSLFHHYLFLFYLWFFFLHTQNHNSRTIAAGGDLYPSLC